MALTKQQCFINVYRLHSGKIEQGEPWPYRSDAETMARFALFGKCIYRIRVRPRT